MSKQDWDKYHDWIQHWYITENMKQEHVIKMLEEHGFNVTYVFAWELCSFIY